MIVRFKSHDDLNMSKLHLFYSSYFFMLFIYNSLYCNLQLIEKYDRLITFMKSKTQYNKH